MAGFCHWRHALIKLAAIVLRRLTGKVEVDIREDRGGGIGVGAISISKAAAM